MSKLEILNKYKNILVVGLGFRTGLQTANYLASQDISVSISDNNTIENLQHLIDKLDDKVKVFAGSQDVSLLENKYDLIILSPGVPVKIPLIQEALKKNIPVISEVELAYLLMKGYWIAITGTDGKSTTTALTNFIMQKIGEDSKEGGNIGIPLISLVETSTNNTITVAELSSYQLETIDTFKPDVAAILNLTPDHLDRYDTLEDYFKAKFRISENQKSDSFFVYNADDENICKWLKDIIAIKKSFSLSDKNANAYYENGFIYLKLNNKYEKLIETEKLNIIGLHNVQNVMTGLLLIQSLYEKINKEFPIEKIVKACYAFTGLDHRMQNIKTFEERSFINDSKATTVGATEMALKSSSESSIFIIGGKAKGDDYSRLAVKMQGKIKGLILIGETSLEFSKVFKNISHKIATDMDDAIIKAMQMSQNGDTIILSPACASFDMYKNFEERGEVFKESVNKLCRGELQWT